MADLLATAATNVGQNVGLGDIVSALLPALTLLVTMVAIAGMAKKWMQDMVRREVGSASERIHNDIAKHAQRIDDVIEKQGEHKAHIDRHERELELLREGLNR